MKKEFTVILLLLTLYSFSQNHELGKVTVAELKEKAYSMDTSAVASVIFKTSKIYFNYEGDIINETKVKLKIYKKEGYSYGNIKEQFWSADDDDAQFTDVATYNLENDKIIITKPKKESQFIEVMSSNLKAKKIAMPDVKVGSIIEYKIRKKTNNYFQPVNFYFQDVIPISDIQLIVEYSGHLSYNKLMTGFLSPDIKSETFGVSNSSFLSNRIIYSLKNVPAFKDEGYVNNIRNYITRLRYELSSIKDYYGNTKPIITDWKTVTKRINEFDNFGGELNKTGYFESEIDKAISGLTSSNEKITAIFNYVKSNMSWNEYYGFTCNDGVKKAFKNKKGNVAEINLMLIAMLRYAKIDTNPILLSTRDNGITDFPSMNAYNYVIAGVELPNQLILLDATNKNALPDIIPIRDLNGLGRIVRTSQSSADIDLMPKLNSKDVVSIMAAISAEGEITGKIREQYFDYNAFEYRDDNKSVSKDGHIETLEKKYQGLEIGEFEVQNKDDLSLPIVENYSFTSNNSVEIIGNKMYISPLLFFTRTENPFKQETREYPIDFVYPNQDKYMVSLTIPDGYAVETLPQSKALSMPGNLGGFKYMISNNGSQVQLVYTQDNNQAIIASEAYQVLKDYYKEIVSKQTEKIVLKKI
ncbi:MAG: DUF3857 domain-containing protein [Flavobacterium sp.]|uniref:transglutaminase domain-containing protein n=1 Tax=Flavobacterium sp. TaxID=239 RepID=UPI003263A0D2